MADKRPSPAREPRERQRCAEDLSAMRQLANESAQAAIKIYEKRSSLKQALVNAAYLLIMLPCFAVLWRGTSAVNDSLTGVALSLGCLVSIAAGTRSVHLFLRSQA